MALNDVYQIKLTGTYQGITWNNVWWYRQLAGAATTATALGPAWQTGVHANLAAFQNDEVDYTQLSVINYRLPSDSILSTPTITAGARAGTSNPAPTFLSASIRWNRNGPGTRYSYTRLVGLLEEDFSANALEAAAVALLTTAANSMTNTLISGANQWQRVQVGGNPTLGVNPTVNFALTTPGLAYRLGTQNTRKT